jgi:hypothetical protein
VLTPHTHAFKPHYITQGATARRTLSQLIHSHAFKKHHTTPHHRGRGQFVHSTITCITTPHHRGRGQVVCAGSRQQAKRSKPGAHRGPQRLCARRSRRSQHGRALSIVQKRVNVTQIRAYQHFWSTTWPRSVDHLNASILVISTLSVTTWPRSVDRLKASKCRVIYSLLRKYVRINTFGAQHARPALCRWS